MLLPVEYHELLPENQRKRGGVEGVGYHKLRMVYQIQERQRPILLEASVAFFAGKHRVQLPSVFLRHSPREANHLRIAVKIVQQDIRLRIGNGLLNGSPCFAVQQEHRVHHLHGPRNAQPLHDCRPGAFPNRNMIQPGQPPLHVRLPFLRNVVHGKAGRVGRSDAARRRKVQIERRVFSVGEKAVPYLVASRKVDVRFRRVLLQVVIGRVAARGQRQELRGKPVVFRFPVSGLKPPRQFRKVIQLPNDRLIICGVPQPPKRIMIAQIVRLIVNDLGVMPQLAQVGHQRVGLQARAHIVYVMAGNCFDLHTFSSSL